MKLKHWAGYGSVQAEKVERSYNTKTGCNRMVIKVSGLHECGLDRSRYKYDCFNWLLKRFDKKVANLDDRIIDKIDYTESWDSTNRVDIAYYTFTYRY